MRKVSNSPSVSLYNIASLAQNGEKGKYFKKFEAMDEPENGGMWLTYGFASLYNNIVAQKDNVGAMAAYKDKMQRVIDESSHRSEDPEKMLSAVI